MRETGIDIASLQRVAGEMAALEKPRRRASTRAATRAPTASSANDDSPEAMDLVAPVRAVPLELVSGRGHYDRVIDAVRSAHTSVWIATANVKELMIEDGRARPGQRRSMKRRAYVSVLSILDELSARGVELRLLHAELPSRPFREELANHPRLLGANSRDDNDAGLALRRCPRVHMKVVVIDGELLYLGSANWTGAGLGARGSGRRNFELGIVTSDAPMLDEVQRLYDHVWRGAACEGCRLRTECPGPLVELGAAAPPRPKRRRRTTRRRL
ncbi:MAG: phospholipase D family protein [Myxococcota bacterium]|nr:phospholipase D family protein [Myxococcota bacterium]